MSGKEVQAHKLDSHMFTSITPTAPGPKLNITYKYDQNKGEMVPVVKRGRGRPRKYPLPITSECVTSPPGNAPIPHKLPKDEELIHFVLDLVNKYENDFG